MEMQHNAAFHQGLHCEILLRIKTIFGERKSIYLEIMTCDPSIYRMTHPKSIVSYHVEETIRTQKVKLWPYSKSCLKRPLKNRQNNGSILQ